MADIRYASGLRPTTSETKTAWLNGNKYEVVFSSADPVEVYVIKTRHCYGPPAYSSTYRTRITAERKIKDVLRNGVYVE